MLLLATTLLAAFIMGAVLSETDADDDDNGPQGGLMQPI
jgi:hypothetical protein